MRFPRVLVRIRLFLYLAALVAIALVVYPINRDGPEARWLLLKLRYGNVEARRSAAIEILKWEPRAVLPDILGSLFPPPANPPSLEMRERRQAWKAALFLTSLLRAAEDADVGCRAHALKALGSLSLYHLPDSEKLWALRQILAAARDPDAGCRAHALKALSLLSPWHVPDSEKLLALRRVLVATGDPNDAVRTAAVGALTYLADQDVDAVFKALGSGLADQSFKVREMTIVELGLLGINIPTTQSDAASILIPLLASQQDSRTRVNAAWGMCLFGVDSRRHPPGTGPDVVPALVSALHDPDVDVRRAAAQILGRTTFETPGGRISSWDQRRSAIIPALDAAITDDDKTVREESALALFAFGRRDQVVIDLIEQAVDDPARSQKSQFESALRRLDDEQEASDAAEPAAPGYGAS